MGFLAPLVPLLIKAGTAIAASIAVSFVASKLRKKPKFDTDSLDFEQVINRRLRSGQPLEVLFGRRITAGVGAFDDSYSTKLQNAVQVTIFSAKPCTAFHKLYLDGEAVTLSGDPTTAVVNVTSHFLGKSNVPRATFRLYLGDNNTGLGALLAGKFPAKFSAGDDFGDYCVGILECVNTNDDFDEEDGKNYIPFQGFPDVKVELSGAKVCDPSVGGFDYADENTYVYSDNPGLIEAQLDYGLYSGAGANRALIVGNGYPVEFLDNTQTISNKDYCTAQGFTCAGVVRSGSQSDMDEVRKCFNADRVEDGSKVYSIPEGNRPFAETIDLSNWPSAIVSDYDKNGFSTEVYNEITTVYSEPQELYGEKELPTYSDAAWIAADNHIPRQLPLPLLMVTSTEAAARLQKQEIYGTRFSGSMTIEGLPYGYIRVKRGHLVTINGTNISGADGKQWIVDERGNTSEGLVTLALREYAGTAAYDFDAGAEIPGITVTPPIPRAWPWWDQDDFVLLQTANIVSGTTTLTDVNIDGVGSLKTVQESQNTNIDGLSGGAAGLSVAVTPGFAFASGFGNVTTNSVTATVTNGSGGETLSWQLVSGDTFTVDSPAAATTTFSIDNGAGGGFSAIYKVVVNDGGTIAEATVSVTSTSF